MSEDILQTLLSTLTKEQKEQLVAKLITDVGNLQPEQEPEPTTNPSKSNDFSTNWGKNIEGKAPVKAKSNTWSDTGESRDPDFDPSKYEAMGRATRPEASRTNMVKKTCSVCNKEFEIASSLVYGEFIRCNRCTG